ncbi:hypothetical protein BU16DRAFT_544632 [Lophium mytilinum]|uniref:Uncharacterized protein n=1 Tax=Lophium mytilinum TaxID=390894 RepID=A0A6A6QA57_9PEZI|nr:hypothetical protein BU16DRAFT_544632 [Lophium mytilinum]
MAIKSFLLGLLTGFLLTLAGCIFILLWLKPYLTAGKSGLRVFRSVRGLWRRRPRNPPPDVESSYPNPQTYPVQHPPNVAFAHPQHPSAAYQQQPNSQRAWHTVELQAASAFSHARSLQPPRPVFGLPKRAKNDSGPESAQRARKPVAPRLNTDVAPAATPPPLQRVLSNVEYPRRSQESSRGGLGKVQ